MQADQDVMAALVSLSAPVGDELGAFSYRLVLDAEGKAVLEAAIGPLSASPRRRWCPGIVGPLGSAVAKRSLRYAAATCG